MEIKLEPTLRAEYHPDYIDSEPGSIHLYFGEAKIGKIPVTEGEHRDIEGKGNWVNSSEGRERAICEITAAHLRDIWGLK